MHVVIEIAGPQRASFAYWATTASLVRVAGRPGFDLAAQDRLGEAGVTDLERLERSHDREAAHGLASFEVLVAVPLTSGTVR